MVDALKIAGDDVSVTKDRFRAPRHRRSSCYMVGKHDQTVNPELERSGAKRMGATTVELDSDHVPMLSHPDVVADLIFKAAGAVPQPPNS